MRKGLGTDVSNVVVAVHLAGDPGSVLAFEDIVSLGRARRKRTLCLRSLLFQMFPCAECDTRVDWGTHALNNGSGSQEVCSHEAFGSKGQSHRGLVQRAHAQRCAPGRPHARDGVRHISRTIPEARSSLLLRAICDVNR